MNYNTATNMMLCWNFINNNQSWSNVLKARVDRNGKLINYSIRSSIWHGINEAYGTVVDQCMWTIGNGQKVNFWIDNWTGEALINKFNIPENFHFALTSKVRDWWIDKSWRIKRNVQQAIPNLLGVISDFSILDIEAEDLYVWKSVVNGKLTLKIAYDHICNPSPTLNCTSFPWDIDSLPSHSMLTWRLMQNKAPTDEQFHM